MKYVIAALALTALLGGPATAQTQLDHNVQRAWDNLFNPPPPGDPRTNWERRRDQERHAEWCRYHPRAEGCGRYY